MNQTRLMFRFIHWKSLLIGCSVGAAAVFLSAYTIDAAKHINHLPAPSEVPVAKPLKPLQVDTAWVKSGNPKFHLAWQTRTRKTSAGLWSCDGPATFEWQFDSDEQIYVLEGTVHIEYLGKKLSLKPGDTALFLAGTKAVWHVPGYFKKSFTIHQPNVAVRLYRRVFGVA
jgi:uncharacterized cupin superfamily protein